MHNNSLYGFHYCKDTYLCYTKIMREYRLVRDFNFIMPYEVSQSVLLGCTRTDAFVNKFSNLSALVAQTYGAPFVNLLFNLFLDDFVMIYYLIYDNSAQWLNYHK